MIDMGNYCCYNMKITGLQSVQVQEFPWDVGILNFCENVEYSVLEIV